nr:hypothetical protein [Tanacetum cinerariifolium]
MASFDYRLNPLYPIKECSSCGALYNTDYCCSDGSLGDKIICDLDKTPDLSQRPLRIVLSVETQLMVIIVKDVLFSERNLRKICLHIVLKMEFSKILLSHPITIPMLLMLFKSHSLSIKTPLCGRGAHYGYNCPPKVSVVPDPEPFNNQTDDELSQTLPSFDPTCYSEDGNSFTYDSTSNLVYESPNVFDPPLQPPTYSYEFCGNDAYYCHDLYINTSSWDRPTICYSDDDDEDYTIAITSSLSTEEPDNSLNMRDEHLDTISVMESDEFIKSSVESLVPIPSESEGVPDNICDVSFHNNSPPLDISKDQFEDFFDSKDDSTSNDDDSFFIDNIEYVEASPPNSELVSSENINLLIANIEALNDNLTPSSDFMTKSSSTSLNSLLEETNTFDNSLPEFETFCFDLEEISSGSTTTRSDISLPQYKDFYDDHIDSLFDEFVGELTLLKSIPSGFNETDCDPKEDTHFIMRLLYDNSSPRPPKGFVSENSDAAIKSFSPSLIPIEDSNSLMEEIDLSFTSDDPMPSGIEKDDYDSEREILILEELLSNNSLSLSENESFHFDIPSSSRPPAKPSDGNTGILNVKVMGDISEHKAPHAYP